MRGSFVWFRIGMGKWNCSAKITDGTVLYPDVRGDSDSKRHQKVAERYAADLQASGYATCVRSYSPSMFYIAPQLTAALV